MKKLFSFLFSLPVAYCLQPTAVSAQQLPLSNQYTLNKFFLSPAFAGAGEGFEVYGTYRNEWMNVPGAPETRMVSANGTICKNMGLGGSITSQQAGIFENLSASASYAYYVKLSGGHTLGFGLGAGLLESRLNLAGTGADANDPMVANNADVNVMVLDANFGFLYRFKGIQTGFAVPRMLTSKMKNDDGTKVFMLSPHYRAHVGYTYTINNDWAVDPATVVSIAENAPVFYEVAVPIIYKQKVWLTPIYKKTSMAIGIGGIPYANFMANYSYAFSSAGIMGESGGTHEITIGWRMAASKKKSDQPAPDKKKPYIDWILK